jgi:glyoxylase-like metal-dependent hydrolase (beta-lactamase superfamily II)
MPRVGTWWEFSRIPGRARSHTKKSPVWETWRLVGTLDGHLSAYRHPQLPASVIAAGAARQAAGTSILAQPAQLPTPPEPESGSWWDHGGALAALFTGLPAGDLVMPVRLPQGSGQWAHLRHFLADPSIWHKIDLVRVRDRRACGGWRRATSRKNKSQRLNGGSMTHPGSTLRLSDMAPVLMAVTETVHLAQGGAVNWLLVTDDTGVMLIDAGYPGDRDDVLTSLRQLGYQAGDVRAILLTHAHIDHMGSAIWFAKTHDTPVYCHPDEVGHTKREYLEQVSPVDVALRIWRPRWALWATHVVRNGGLIREGIPTALPLTAEVAAELPGHPMAIPTPGHTGGHCSYLLDGILASGDALVTGHPLLARRGPQLLPAVFSHDQDGCIRSLAALALLDTEVLVPGHGDLWRGPIRAATEEATALAQ